MLVHVPVPELLLQCTLHDARKTCIAFATQAFSNPLQASQQIVLIGAESCVRIVWQVTLELDTHIDDIRLQDPVDALLRKAGDFLRIEVGISF